MFCSELEEKWKVQRWLIGVLRCEVMRVATGTLLGPRAPDEQTATTEMLHNIISKNTEKTRTDTLSPPWPVPVFVGAASSQSRAGGGAGQGALM